MVGAWLGPLDRLELWDAEIDAAIAALSTITAAMLVDGEKMIGSKVWLVELSPICPRFDLNLSVYHHLGFSTCQTLRSLPHGRQSISAVPMIFQGGRTAVTPVDVVHRWLVRPPYLSAPRLEVSWSTSTRIRLQGLRGSINNASGRIRAGEQR